MNSNDFETELQILLHEIIHGLGFHESMYEYFYDFKTTNRYPKPVLQEINVIMLTTPRLIALAKLYFNCDSINEIRMEEYTTNGTLQTAASHFERALFYNEILTHA